MPYWIQRTVVGALTCLFCGSFVMQVGSAWFCLDVSCIKHADMPIEQQKGFAGWINPEPTAGTASLPSTSTYSFGTIGKVGG